MKITIQLNNLTINLDDNTDATTIYEAIDMFLSALVAIGYSIEDITEIKKEIKG
jgi:DNA-binding transcriptional regulator YhcF (GntR family)